MRIAVQAESDANESRVAATPETVKALTALGAEVVVEAGAGLRSAIPDEAYREAGAVIAESAAAAAAGADVLLRVRRPSAADVAGVKPGAAVIAIMDPYEHIDALQSLAGGGRQRLRDGADPAYHTGAVDGRPVEPGEPRGLPRRHRRGGGLRPRHPDDDDGRRIGSAGAHFHHGRRRRRPAGDRDGSAHRRRRHRDRRPARDEGAGALARRQIHRRRGRGIRRRRDRGRLCEADVAGISGETGRAHRLAHRQAGYRRNDGAHSRPRRRRC